MKCVYSKIEFNCRQLVIKLPLGGKNKLCCERFLFVLLSVFFPLYFAMCTIEQLVALQWHVIDVFREKKKQIFSAIVVDKHRSILNKLHINLISYIFFGWLEGWRHRLLTIDWSVCYCIDVMYKLFKVQPLAIDNVYMPVVVCVCVCDWHIWNTCFRRITTDMHRFFPPASRTMHIYSMRAIANIDSLIKSSI